MKKNFIVSLFVLLLVLSACSSEKPKDQDDDKLQVITSFTIIEDMARTIGGDKVSVYNLVPSGTDPHEYEPRPNDIKAAEDADLLLYNGMNLEGGVEGWFLKMVQSTNQPESKVFDLNEGVEPRYLSGEDGQDEEVNPHSFLDPKIGIKMTENLLASLVKTDPENKEYYQDNAETYLKRLEEIDQKYHDVVESIPEKDRILVTSEHAFQYMSESYGLREAYVWEIDTEELGTPEQIKNLVDHLREIQPPVLFLESNVDPRPLETVSNETGIKIFEEPIYADEIGIKGSEVDTYIKLLNHNIRIIEAGLTQ